MMNALEARVQAANTAGIMANELQPKLIAAMRKFVGCQVVTKQDALTAQVKKAVAEVLGDSRGVTLDSYKRHSLRWEVSVSVSTGERSLSFTVSMYVGSVSDRVLTKVNEEFQPHRVDYSAEHIKALREACRIAQDAQDKLIPIEIQNMLWHRLENMTDETNTQSR